MNLIDSNEMTYLAVRDYVVCGENDRSKYGKSLLNYLSTLLAKEFGKGTLGVT